MRVWVRVRKGAGAGEDEREREGEGEGEGGDWMRACEAVRAHLLERLDELQRTDVGDGGELLIGRAANKLDDLCGDAGEGGGKDGREDGRSRWWESVVGKDGGDDAAGERGVRSSEGLRVSNLVSERWAQGRVWA